MANYYVKLPNTASGVSSLDSLTGALTLVAGTGITIMDGTNTITISATGVAGIGSINSDTTNAQLLQVGTAGSDFNIDDAGGGVHNFNLPTASATKRGALSSADWSTFNSKQAALTIGNLTSSDITVTGGTGAIIGSGTSLAIVKGNLTDAGTDGITVTGGSNAVLGAGTSISQHVADSTHNGYLSSADWSTFNNKQAALTIGNLTDVGTDGITVTGGSNAVLGSGTSIAQHVADGTHNGYLSSTDWNTFNNKQAALTIGNLTDVGTDGIVITGGSGAIIGSGTSIAQHVADTTHNGYLSSTDWNTFNGKQAAGNYITDLTGDGTASGPGSAALTLATVNTNTGSFGSSTSIPNFTVNGKGLITAAGGNAVIAPAGTLSGTTLNSTVVTSSLTAVGVITTGTWNGVCTMGSSFLTAGVTYTTPSNVTSATQFKFTLIGGGGAGGGSTTTNTTGSGGGAGGTCIVYLTGLTASTGYTIAIGGGGTGSSGASGGNGGNTTLTVGGTTYTAGLGTGGVNAVGSSLGGAGGSSTNGTINIPGQTGGNSASNSWAGSGGTTMFGSGGGGVLLPGSTHTDGNAGTGYGSGGSGSSSKSSTGNSGTGGNGMPGCILVEWGN